MAKTVWRRVAFEQRGLEEERRVQRDGFRLQSLSGDCEDYGCTGQESVGHPRQVCLLTCLSPSLCISLSICLSLSLSLSLFSVSPSLDPFLRSSHSGHEIKNVWDELLSLCLPFVSNSSYCIVEDTVLGTPFDALRVFFNLTESSDFCIDQDREYFGLSQHRGGYLKRVQTTHQTDVPQKMVQTINSAYSKQQVGQATLPAPAKYKFDRERLEKAVAEAMATP
jgi:hypothetical protein